MLNIPGGGRIFLATGITDMRKSYDGLSGVVRSRLGCDPLSGDLFLFSNRLRNRLKLLYFDTTGMWVFAKRLERGTFAWPRAEEGQDRIELRYEELMLLVSGLDALELRERKRWRRKAS